MSNCNQEFPQNQDGCQPIFTIYIGDDVILQPFQVLRNGIAVDLTGVTEIEIDFVNDPASAAAQAGNPIYKALLSTSQIALNADPKLGMGTLTIPNAATTSFKAFQLTNCDIIVTGATGKIQTYRVFNGLSIVNRGT